MNAVAPPPDAFDALKAELFGRAYELFVKRGVLYCLIERGVVPPDHFALEPWLDFAPADVLSSLYDQLDIVDDAGRQQLRDAIDHIAHCAFLSGYCAIRAWLNALPHKPVACKALFAPFALLDQRNSKAALCADIIDAFGIPLRHEPERLAEKGMPANADFAIQILDAIGHDHLLVLEFSNLLAPRLDFTAEAAHIAEVQQRQNLIDARGVFTRIAAEVDGDSFKLSPGIAENLNAFTTSDKPLYKLCQACAYAAALARLMLSLKKIKTRLHVRASPSRQSAWKASPRAFARATKSPMIFAPVS